jgi:hypothetical protein
LSGEHFFDPHDLTGYGVGSLFPCRRISGCLARFGHVADMEKDSQPLLRHLKSTILDQTAARSHCQHAAALPPPFGRAFRMRRLCRPCRSRRKRRFCRRPRQSPGILVTLPRETALC